MSLASFHRRIYVASNVTWHSGVRFETTLATWPNIMVCSYINCVHGQHIVISLSIYVHRIPYGGKLWQWENLTNSLQKVIGRIKFGEFAMYVAS